MELSEVAKPGLMISQTWPESRSRDGETLRAVETALAQGFFHALQFVEVPFERDHHIRFGPPGALGETEIGTIMAGMFRGGFFLQPGIRPGVYCEVLKLAEDDSIELMHYCRRTLENAWFGAQRQFSGNW